MNYIKSGKTKIISAFLAVSFLSLLFSGCDIKSINNSESASNCITSTSENKIENNENPGSTSGGDVSSTAGNTADNSITSGQSTDDKKTEGNTVNTPINTNINTSKPTDPPTEKPNYGGQDAQKWINRYSALGMNGDKVLMSFDEIKKFNKDLDIKCESIVNVIDIPANMSKDTLKYYIETSSCPDLPKYDWSGTAITEEKRNSVNLNRNIEALSGGGDQNVRMGIITQRADLRTVPTDTPFFSSSSDNYYDRIQETELVVGSPVWIMHESKDGRYYYVQAYHYRGWVIKTDVAVTDSASEWKMFLEPESFAVITSSLITVDSAKLDMGVKLPLVSNASGGFIVKLPKRLSDGTLSSVTEFVSSNDANNGYLPYTMNNYYTQAFKYKGAIYGWGGSYDSVDCSGFVSAVFRSFGFYLPRNVSQQRTTCGNLISLDGMGASYIESKLSEINIPAAVYKPGHVMLYLGEIDGKYYIIHSPQGGSTVCEEVLNTSATNIKNVNTFK